MNELMNYMEPVIPIRYLISGKPYPSASQLPDNLSPPSASDLWTLLQRSYNLNIALLKTCQSAVSNKTLEERLGQFQDSLMNQVSDAICEMNTYVREGVKSLQSENEKNAGVPVGQTKSYADAAGAGIGSGKGKHRAPEKHSINSSENLELSVRIKENVSNSSSTCDPFRTVSIKGILNYSKYLNKSCDTLKYFNSFFPRMEVVQCKPTRRGTLLLELASSDDALRVVNGWNPSFLGGDFEGVEASTSAELLASTQTSDDRKAVIDHAGPEFSKEQIVDACNEYLGVDCPDEVIQLKDRSGKPRPQYLLTFSTKSQRDLAIANTICIGNRVFRPREFRTRPRRAPPQCQKCWKFGHPAAWCRGRYRCLHCGDPDHEPGKCDAVASKNRANLKCPNCQGKDDVRHSANSPVCPEYSRRISHHG